MATPDCVTCKRPLPEGREPEYFGQGSIGYTAERQAERAAEDVSGVLRYAQTVNSAIWTMLQVAAAKSPALMDSEEYLDEARSLCFLLVDLVGEAERRVQRLFGEIRELVDELPDKPATTRKEG